MLSILALAALAISPWSGHDLPTATQAAAKYRLQVSGAPGTTVELQATGVANGWIAAFCNDRVCSPMRVAEKIPKSGSAVLQFELIRETDDAPHASGAVIHAAGGGVVIVPRATR